MAFAKRCVIAALVVGTILGLSIPESMGQAQHTPSEDEAAIRQAIKSYVDAFNKGDPAAVASLWSADAEYISPSGDSLNGRKKIEAFLRKFFAENKGANIEVSPSSLRFSTPHKATEVGTATLARPGADPEVTTYVAEHVKKSGAWKLNRIKEEECSVAYAHLRELEWLIGEWIDRDENASVETKYEWTKNRSFITGSFTVSIAGKIDLQGTQVIGWDPVEKTIRSWVFDSQGGFGQATWFRKGNQWISETLSVLSTGEKASGITILTVLDENSLTMQSIGRQFGEDPAPNIDEVVVVRKESVGSPQATGSKRGKK